VGTSNVAVNILFIYYFNKLSIDLKSDLSNLIYLEKMCN